MKLPRILTDELIAAMSEAELEHHLAVMDCVMAAYDVLETPGHVRRDPILCYRATHDADGNLIFVRVNSWNDCNPITPQARAALEFLDRFEAGEFDIPSAFDSSVASAFDFAYAAK